MRILLLTTLLTAFLNACSGITPPTIESIDSIQLVDIEDGIVTLKAEVSLSNSNRIAISGKDLAFEMAYENITLGIGTCSESFSLKAKSTSPLALDIKLYLDSIPEELRMRLFEMDSIPLNMNMSFQGKFGMNHSQRETFKVAMSLLQSTLIKQYFADQGFELKDLRVESSNQSNTLFKGNISFTNTLPFDLTLLGSDIYVYTEPNGVNVGKVTMEDSLSIAKGESVLIPCKMDVNTMKAIGSGFGKILTGSLDYYAIGPLELLLNNTAFKVPVLIHFLYNPLSGKVTIVK